MGNQYMNLFLWWLAAIHGSGVISGISANSGTVNCGGLVCRPISGIFTKNPLPEDAYIHVATIPAGASNISITELKNSVNLLVLRKNDDIYLFNGGNVASTSKVYESSGTPFDYRRIDGITAGDGVTEWITSTGPTKEALELMIYAREKNPGVKYEYLLPISSESEENEISLETEGFLKAAIDDTNSPRASERKKRRFNWKVVSFSPCSKSCGGGIQNPIIRCIRDSPTRYFSPRRCVHSEKPVLNENLLRCNTQPCPAYWRMEEWGECQCSTLGLGHIRREVRCVQELTSGVVIQVNSGACLEESPSTEKFCECPKTHKKRVHHRSKGKIIAPAPANSTVSSNKKVSEHAGVWLASKWNDHCTSECGLGTEHRSIFCDRSPPNKDRCDLKLLPDITRPCEKEKSCEVGDWFTGPWGQCSGSCFNLTRTRQVLCIQNQLIVEGDECNLNAKPIALQNCSVNDVKYCKPSWHYSEWSECTKTCDSGTQRRSVKCLEIDLDDNVLKESKKCRYSEREILYRSCNTDRCPDPRVDLIQNDIVPESCEDEFGTCNVIVKANLCGYDYYKQNCCNSCTSAGFR